MVRWFLYAFLVFVLGSLAVVGWYRWHKNTSVSVPLFLQHDTLIEGIGLSSLGKEFVLRYKQDRILFDVAKKKQTKQRREWKEGKRYSIPKNIHMLWLSDSPLPDSVQHNLSSFKQHNPHCMVTVWNKDALQQQLSEKELSFFKTIPASLQKPVASALLLYHQGGAMVDSSIQCLSSIEDLFFSGEWIASFEPPLQTSESGRHLWLSSAFFAATKEHPLTQAWLSEIQAYFQNEETKTLPLKKQYLEGIILPLMNLISLDPSASYILPATCFTPLAPQFVRSYIKKLAGESSDKKNKKGFSYQETAPFSKIARCSLGIHTEGGTLAAFSSKDKKESDPF